MTNYTSGPKFAKLLKKILGRFLILGQLLTIPVKKYKQTANYITLKNVSKPPEKNCGISWVFNWLCTVEFSPKKRQVWYQFKQQSMCS